MKNIQLLLLLIMLPAGVMATQEKYNSISQKRKRIYLNKEYTELELKREAFTIRFSNRRYTDDAHYATRIAVFTDKELLDKVMTGVNVNEVPYFAPYTGIAADSFGYSSIFMNNEGHHYLYYKEEQDKRANLVSESNGVLELEWSPHSFYLDEQDKDFATAGIDRFYIVIFSDRDLDNTVGFGELQKIAVTFK